MPITLTRRAFGCPDFRKCSVACRPLEESQQPTWPQTRHIRNWTHDHPSLRHSSHPLEFGLTVRI